MKIIRSFVCKRRLRAHFFVHNFVGLDDGVGTFDHGFTVIDVVWKFISSVHYKIVRTGSDPGS